MTLITIAPSCRAIERYLSSLPTNEEGRICISSVPLPEQIIKKLSRRGFKIQRPAVLTGLDTPSFIREYVGMIGRLSQVNHSRLWWATDISTKNRFTCKLPEAVELLSAAYDAGLSGHYREILVMCPFAGFTDSLEQSLARTDVIVRRLSAASEEALGTQFRRWKRQLSLIYHVCRTIVRAFIVRLRLGRVIRRRLAKLQSPAYVIKSFVYRHCFDGKGGYRDEFFGQLPAFLQGQQPVVVLADILGPLGACCRQIAACQSVCIVPLEYFLTWKDLIRAVQDIVTFHVHVSASSSFNGLSVAPLIRAELAQSHNGLRLFHLLHEAYVRNFFKTVPVSTFLYTYENNPWERMCVQAVREHSLKIKILGYQHAIVSEASLNLFFDDEETDLAPLPDKILTVGDMTRNIMSRYGNYRPGMLEPACALRYDYLFSQPIAGRTCRKNILVALGGTLDAAAMVRYVFKEIGKSPEFQVRFRAHPCLPWKKIAQWLGIDIGTYLSVQISTGMTLREDFKWADIVLYWASTVGMEAISVGKPVVHFDRGELVSFDPLANCPHMRWRVTDGVRLSETLHAIYQLDEETFNREQQFAAQYLAGYFYMNSKENMEKFSGAGAAEARRVLTQV